MTQPRSAATTVAHENRRIGIPFEDRGPRWSGSGDDIWPSESSYPSETRYPGGE